MANNVIYTLRYKADMTCLFGILLDREKDVVEVHRLFDRMFCIIGHLRLLEQTLDAEEAERLQSRIEDMKADLRELMQAWCLLESEKQVIWSLTLRTV